MVEMMVIKPYLPGDDGLNKTRDRRGEEAAHGAVADDDRRGDEHGGNVAHVGEEVCEQLAAGCEARGGVGHKEDNDDQRRDALNQAALVAEAVGEEVGDRDSAELLGVDAQALGDNQPVEIGAERKADDRPARVGETAEVGKAGHAHQQPARHVGGLGAHRDDDGAELASAEIEVAGGLVALGVGGADRQHADQIDRNRDHHNNGGRCHNSCPLFSRDALHYKT